MERVNEGNIKEFTEDFTGGYNLLADPSKISEKEFTVFENLIGFEKSRLYNATKRRGIDVYNSNAPTGTGIKSLYEYITNSKDTNFTRLIIKTSSNLMYSVGTGAFTNIGTIADGKVKMLTFNDNLYLFNVDGGDDPNMFYDGTDYLEHGCPPCPQTFTLRLNTGTLPAGAFGYIITFLYENGQESSAVFKKNYNPTTYDEYEAPGDVGTSGLTQLAPIFIATSGGNDSIDILDIPLGNGKCIGRRIYRTAASGDVFYHWGDINDNTTTALMADNKDSNLLVEEMDLRTVLKPLSAKVAVQHGNRLWVGNLKESQYTKKAFSSEPVGTSGVNGGNLSNNGGSNEFRYSYKFANDFSGVEGQSLSSGDFVKPFSGAFGELSDPVIVTSTDTSHNKVSWTGLTNDNEWALRTAIFRTMCSFVSGASGSGTVTITTTANPHYFQPGETVYLEGLQNDIFADFITDGEYLIISATATTFTISALSSSTYASGGTITGGIHYFVGRTGLQGTTQGTTFVDFISDSDIFLQGHQSANLGLEPQVNKSYKSLEQWSEVDWGDLFLPRKETLPNGEIETVVREDFIDPDDNDEIQGMFSEDDGVVVFKDRNIYKTFTTGDERNWETRKLVSGIGASDKFGIIQLPLNEYVFISNNIFYHWRGGYSEPQRASDKIQTILDGLTITNIDICYVRKQNWIIITVDTSTIKGRTFIYDLNIRDERGLGMWLHWKENSTNYLGVKCPLVTKAGDILFGSEYSRIYKYGTAQQDTLNGTAREIAVKIQPKTWCYGGVEFKNIFLWAIVGTDEVSTPQVTITPIVNGSSGTPVNKDTADSITRIQHGITQSGKEISYLLEFAHNVSFTLKRIGHEYLSKENRAV